jgi:predicted DNA-binding transcriptional regulator AlpA
MTIKQLLESIADILQKQAMPDRLWTVEDVADYVGFHKNYVYQLKDRPDFPRPVQLGKQPRYIPEEIKSWIKKQRG